MICVVSVDAPEVELPAGELVLASVPGVHDRLLANTAAWVQAERGAAR